MIPRARTPLRRLAAFPRAAAALALVLFAAGCTTPRRLVPSPAPLPPVGFDSPPAVPLADYPFPQQALFSAFFALGGVSVPPEDLAAAIPLHLPGRLPDPRRLQTLAARNGRLLLAVPASPDRLRRLLATKTPVLLRLDASPRRTAPPDLRLPLSWNPGTRRWTLLRPDGTLETLARLPLSTLRALCLLDPAAPLPWRPSPTERLAIAECQETAGDTESARHAALALLRRPPETSPALAARAHALLGRLAIRDGRPDSAIRHLEAACTLVPSDPRTLNTLAYVLAAHRPDRLADARSLAEAALALDPDNPAILETLGSIDLADGRPAEAAVRLERAWSLSETRPLPEAGQIQILDQLARAYRLSSQPHLAAQVLDHRARLHPSVPLPPDLQP